MSDPTSTIRVDKQTLTSGAFVGLGPGAYLRDMKRDIAYEVVSIDEDSGTIEVKETITRG